MTYQDFFSRYTYDRRADKVVEGPLGAVYKATDTVTGEPVYLRLMIMDDEASAPYSLKEEVAYADSLPAGEWFVRYRDANCYQEATGFVSCAVMPFYPLGTLGRVLKEWKLDDNEKRALAEAIIIAAQTLRDAGFAVPRFDTHHVFVSEEQGRLVPHLFDLKYAEPDGGSFESDVQAALPYSDEMPAEIEEDVAEAYEDDASTSRKWKLLSGVIVTWIAIIGLIGFVHCKRNAVVEKPVSETSDSVSRPIYPADEFVMEEAARADSIAKAKADSIAAFKADSAAYMQKIAAEKAAKAKAREEERRKESETTAVSTAEEQPVSVHQHEASEPTVTPEE